MWVILAGPYVMAGLSKLRMAGLTWIDSHDMLMRIIESKLSPMPPWQEFPPSVETLLQLPSAFYWVIAALALLTELAFIIVPFSARLRPWILLAMATCHIGILFLQDILFLDLIIILIAFSVLAFRDGKKGSDLGVSVSPGGLKERVTIATVITVLFCTWVLRIEYYPLTSMQMFSHGSYSGAKYVELVSVDTFNRERRVHPERLISIIGSTSKIIFLRCQIAAWQEACKALLDILHTNSQELSGEELDRIELRMWHAQVTDPPFRSLTSKLEMVLRSRSD